VTLATSDAIETGELRLAGVRRRALSVPGATPPILLLHGYSDSADTWRPVLAELAARGQSAVAVDLPSHGKADLHGRGPVLAQLRAFASALVEAPPGSVVAGDSLGGPAAEDGAAPLAGVVAVGPHCVQLEAPERLARHLVAFRDDPGRWTSSS
jgi:pimeloyl-ACP methyl ester carboxylesterase